ncbi:MAG: TOBE domain-containing protein [Campylobacterota bacterium]|nr:TOBE domain-containing protein [Campylobacterota bacterium]
MNRINAIITAIESVDNINIVTFLAGSQNMCMMSLELNSQLSVGSKVVIGAKATHIAIAKELSGELSISNQLGVIIEDMTLGELLCSIKFQFNGALIESIITKTSALNMQLQVGSEMTALIKSSELSIVEIL